MNSGIFLLGFLIATIVWQVVAQSLGPEVGKWLYGIRVDNFRKSGLTFNSEAEANRWRHETIASSMNWGLMLLALSCGGLAGICGFPLLGFSRSTNGWSWARIITLCGSSWIALSIVHPSMLESYS